MPERPIRVSRRTLTAIAALLVAALINAGLIQVTDDPTPGPRPAPTATLVHELGGPGHATVPAAAPTPAAALEQLLHDRAPADSAAQQAAAAHNAALKPTGQPRVPPHLPLAAANVEGCKTALVRNYSSRNGAPVLLGVIHWTGSAITPGWAGIDGNLRWFDQSAAQASSNEITDSWGNCALAVPEALKSWTQARFNPWSVSVEIVNPGVLPLFRGQAGFERVVDLIVGWHERWKIPLQHARVSCPGGQPHVDRPGILAHRDLGPCGGGHPDVGDGGDVDRLIAAANARVARNRITSVDRATCRRLNRWRRHGRPHGLAQQRAVHRRAALTSRGLRCTLAGPVRAT